MPVTPGTQRRREAVSFPACAIAQWRSSAAPLKYSLTPHALNPSPSKTQLGNLSLSLSLRVTVTVTAGDG